LPIFKQKDKTKITLKEVSKELDKLKLPIGLVFTPTNLITEKVKFFESESYNPVFQYRIVKNKNKEILEKLMEIEEIVDVDPRISEFYLRVIYHKYLTDRLMKSVGENSKITKYSEEKYGSSSPILFRNACRVLRGKTDNYNIFDSKKLNNEEYLEYDQIEQIVNETFNLLGLSGWKVKKSLNIARNGVKIGIKAKEFLVDRNIRKRPTELKKTIIHEIGTHVLRAINGESTGIDALRKPNVPEYLDTEEGLAMYNEELMGLLSEKDLRKRALFVWAVKFGEDLTFRDLYNAALGFLSPKEAFDLVYRVKRGLGDTSLPGIYSKDIVYFRGFRRIRKKVKEIVNMYNFLYAGKISTRQYEWVEDGLIPKPKIIPSKEMFDKIFKQVGI